jgi:signal transduction histidine kinase
MTGTLVDRLPPATLSAIYRVKVVALCVIVGVLWTLHWTALPAFPVARYSGVIALVLVPSALIAAGRSGAPDWLVAASLAADVLAVTAGIQGAAAWTVSGPLQYGFVVVLAAVVLSPRAAWIVAAGSGAAYALLVWTERGLPAPAAGTPAAVLVPVVSVVAYLLLGAWGMAYALEQVRGAYRLADRLRREAVSALSHDLKNPLGIVLGYAEMLEEEASPDERKAQVRGILRAARLANDLVHNVLDTAAIEGRGLVARREPCELNEVVTVVIELYAHAADSKGVRLRPGLAAGLPVLEADARLLGRAIGNLVSNAIKYTGPDGNVEVTTRAGTAGTVAVDVTDDGPGIPPAEQAKLFRAWSRTASGRDVEGTGLGLYIVRSIATAHAGSVAVRSAPGAGSTFTLELPVAPAA